MMLLLALVAPARAAKLPRLPGLAPPRPREASPDQGTGQAPTRTDALRILVVDDDSDVASMLAMLLEEVGHDVTVVGGSHRALERARAEAYDVCVLDIGLPDIDGNELARRIQAIPDIARPLLIAVTGYGTENRRRSMEAGFDHYLVKPVHTGKLLKLLAERRDALAGGTR